MQCSAYAVALMPPATSPAKAPARARFVVAASRTAQMETANGRTAEIETRQSSHSSPTIILFFQCELGASPRLIDAIATITRNGMATRCDRDFRSRPGAPALQDRRARCWRSRTRPLRRRNLMRWPHYVRTDAQPEGSPAPELNLPRARPKACHNQAAVDRFSTEEADKLVSLHVRVPGRSA